MSSAYKIYDDQLPHFVTFTVVGWVDVFSREQYMEIICSSLAFCQKNKGLVLHAWVIMTNHVHLIVSAQAGKRLGHIVRDMKKFTSIEITDAITKNDTESRKAWMLNMFAYAGSNNRSNEKYQFWLQDFHPICLDTQEKTIQRLNYVHDNPVKAGIVWMPEQYKYSSACDYMTKQAGLLPLQKLVL